MNRLSWLLFLAGAFFGSRIASAIDATVVTLEGAEHRGRLAAVSADAITLRDRTSSETPIRFSAGEVHWLRLGAQTPSSLDDHVGFVETLDGSRLTVTNLTTDGKTLTIELAQPFQMNNDGRLDLPYEHVAAYVFQTGRPELYEEWRRIRAVDATADLIVVKRKEGQTLDYVEGIVTEVTAQAVKLELDGEPIEVDRGRVYGVVCFRPDASVDESLIRVQSSLGELRAVGLRTSAEESLQVTLAAGAIVSLPLDQVTAIDYSRGRLMPLSDLEPTSVEWRPYYHPPGEEDLAFEWGRMRRDRSYSGGPLTLKSPDGRILTYAKGLAIRSRGEATYRVPAGFNWFRATIGLDPEPRLGGDVTFRIEGDGRELFARSFTRRDEPFELDLPVSEVTELRLRVDYGANGDTGDNLHLGNARFTK